MSRRIRCVRHVGEQAEHDQRLARPVRERSRVGQAGLEEFRKDRAALGSPGKPGAGKKNAQEPEFLGKLNREVSRLGDVGPRRALL